MKRSNYIQNFKNEFENNKSKFIVYFLLRGLIILCLILQLIRKEYENAALCILSLILLFLPFIIERRLKVDLPNTIEIIIMLFVFSAEILGEINNFYGIIPFWDTILHTLNGFLMAAIGFSLFDILNKNLKSIHLSPIFLCLFSFCFSMTIGIIWEFFEYGMDNTFNYDMQKDEYINEINTVTLDPAQSNKVITIDNIDYTIIYDKNDSQLARFNGYLDIGLNDTMKDLMVNYIGAIIFNIFGYLYLKNRDDKFIKNFIIKKRETCWNSKFFYINKRTENPRVYQSHIKTHNIKYYEFSI